MDWYSFAGVNRMPRELVSAVMTTTRQHGSPGPADGFDVTLPIPVRSPDPAGGFVRWHPTPTDPDCHTWEVPVVRRPGESWPGERVDQPVRRAGAVVVVWVLAALAVLGGGGTAWYHLATSSPAGSGRLLSVPGPVSTSAPVVQQGAGGAMVDVEVVRAG